MIANLIAEIGDGLHTIFIANFTLVVLIGLIGQLLFTARFLVQWIASERAGRSVIPISFWYFSLGGGMILLGYAIYRQDPVFILGQGLGTFIYLRNLMLIAKARRKDAEGGDA
ncbi:MAG: lipid-A-disaccharide synthase N-terminal domain-containing protein [Microvirga sp.]|nr:lipid-A-disaccharide synthase N-terminal domain-containing protein [Microvirga sp.]